MGVTIKDVARYCGVSVSTVSKCLNGYTEISEDTASKVFDAIKKLDFVPSNAARQMTQKNTKIIGLTIPDIIDPFFSESAFSAEETLVENGYQLFYGNMGRSPEKLLHFLQQAREMRFDGLIITPDHWTSEILSYLDKLAIPVVSLRRRPPQSIGIPYVDNDHYQGAIQMMIYLASLGHKNIAHIVLPTQIGNFRHNAYLDFCKIYSIQPRDVMINMPANKLCEARENGYLAMKEIMSRYPDTTAVFAGTDELAIGAMTYLKEIGLRVPDDISISGVDDVDYSSLPWFDLTTMSLNRVEMGHVAARMLLDMLEKRDCFPENKLIGSSLIVRGSTKKK